jgi:hypothetical protein
MTPVKTPIQLPLTHDLLARADALVAGLGGCGVGSWMNIPGGDHVLTSRDAGDETRVSAPGRRSTGFS